MTAAWQKAQFPHLSLVAQVLSARKSSPPSLPIHLIPIVHAIARRTIPTPPSATLKPIINPDTATWPQSLASLRPTPSIFFSALGTSRAVAGSLAAQRAVDYDLNLSLARTAKEQGVRVYVIISSAGVSKSSPIPYSKMKGEIEEEVKVIKFPYTVIVKPGLLLGKREESRSMEALLQGVARGMGMINKGWLMDWWAQDVDVIGRAAVVAGMECLQGKKEEGVWELGQSEIIKLGKKD